EDASKQGTKIESIDTDKDITLMDVENDEELRALIDGKKVVITEDVIRRDLHLDDADGVECLLNEEIFAELA
nr:hypothetical protein [Tanacetum cinerariifolium]